jgi:hypothetical protein
VAKPRGDLGALIVPKAAAAQAVPHAPAPSAPAPTVPPAAPPRAASPPRPVDGGAPKALTVKLDGPTYRRLRRHCQDQENATGREPTHQEVMVAALLAFLEGQGNG